MPRALVYYPFKLNPWWGKSVTFTLNSQTHQIDYSTEMRGITEKEQQFRKVISDRGNKLYIVGHCNAGENELYSEPTGDKEESINYLDLANRIYSYSTDAPGEGSTILATIKILACQSGAAKSVAPRAGLLPDCFGAPVQRGFISFAQKLWDELYYKYGLRCTCHAYTRSLWWDIHTQSVGEQVVKVEKPTTLKAAGGNRFFIDEEGALQRAHGCRITLVASPNKVRRYTI